MTDVARPEIRTEIGWSTSDRIYVRGYDLTRDLIGTVDLAGMTYLEIVGRMPTEQEARMLNALMVTIVEHGITPSVISARMTYLGAPEALQGAVAAGLLGAGSVYLGAMEYTARMLAEALAGKDGQDLAAIAREVVTSYRSRKAIIPGIGHPIHSEGDPRVTKLVDLASELGFNGKYVQLLLAISDAAGAARGKPLPVNAAGVLGAIGLEMGFDWRLVKGLALIARTIGLVGHLAEEIRQPFASGLWEYVDRSAAHPEPRPAEVPAR